MFAYSNHSNKKTHSANTLFIGDYKEEYPKHSKYSDKIKLTVFSESKNHVLFRINYDMQDITGAKFVIPMHKKDCLFYNKQNITDDTYRNLFKQMLDAKSNYYYKKFIEDFEFDYYEFKGTNYFCSVQPNM